MAEVQKYDALIIGGGHNGLVCACYLAAAGLKVRVLERRSVIGGAAVTEEFFPGYRNSTASYTVSLLHPQVIRDLRLHEHGLQILERPVANFLPLANGRHLTIGPTLEATQRAVAPFSTRDAAELPRYYAMLERVADVMRQLAVATPPNVGGGVRDALAALMAGNRMELLGAHAPLEFRSQRHAHRELGFDVIDTQHFEMQRAHEGRSGKQRGESVGV